MNPAEDSAHFVVKAKDVLYMFHADVKIAFEVVTVQRNINIAPYNRKNVLHKRDDLSYIDGLKD
ncbi:hypothetical protein [Glaciimonas immobilis]|uniref:Uncharacterized protein n=1 Tax=Glaciimonas immobilis TaxID=728004 RepID=A0A840S1F9_9BURK|nr:hypothetical protein [Glaciimonas immobilis]KAF3995908.1 hypothetical protein HAV38_21430 [Glaciimonas immobilis]MBB5202694.1 hypothetical protein [Glaciimonas immobilis]